MPLKFGTSGLRGLVADMTPAAVARYTRAFLAACACGDVLLVGQDLRPSSLRIAADVMAAARAAGIDVVDCGALPTPALALTAQMRGGAAIMVTGSHIPADRNGLKFYTPNGEITKDDEAAILSSLKDIPKLSGNTQGRAKQDTTAGTRFVMRYVDAFGPQALVGRRIGLYAHSAVGRDLLGLMLTAMGATVVELGRSETFIPVDTEAVDTATRAQITEWVENHALDALVSTDGDSDRPLLADEYGRIVPGDILGQITAQALGAEAVVTPISSNSGVLQKGFHTVRQTAIGSPFVIAAMNDTKGAVVGYEANGGFLLGFPAKGPAGIIAPLMTRDCMLPLVVTLHAAGDRPVSERVGQEPPVVTLSDRLQEVPQEITQPLIVSLATEKEAREGLLNALGAVERSVDLTDGVRITLDTNAVVHIRPSGNAPELRLYVEAATQDAAARLMEQGLAELRRSLQPEPKT